MEKLCGEARQLVVAGGWWQMGTVCKGPPLALHHSQNTTSSKGKPEVLKVAMLSPDRRSTCLSINFQVKISLKPNVIFVTIGVILRNEPR